MVEVSEHIFLPSAWSNNTAIKWDCVAQMTREKVATSLRSSFQFIDFVKCGHAESVATIDSSGTRFISFSHFYLKQISFPKFPRKHQTTATHAHDEGNSK